MAALREHPDSAIRKRTTSRHIDYGKKEVFKRSKVHDNGIRNLTDWVPSLCTPYQPLVNFATRKEAPKNG